MSEHVDRSLEEFLPVFEQLQRVQLFTEKEVRVVINKCRSFEYRLQKRLKDSADFLRYIDYLSNFLTLIRRRRSRLQYWFKKEDIDSIVTTKIIALFRRVCHRFQGKLDLWLKWIEFLKAKKSKDAVSRVYLKLLKVHSNKPQLWVLAAKWELEENGSAENARKLLQRALRLHPNSAHLWKEHFRLELIYVDKIKKRLEELAMSQEQQVEMEAVPDAVLRTGLARLVFKQATKSMSEDVNLAVEMWRICSKFFFASELAEDIFRHLQVNFKNRVETWQLRIKRNRAEILKKYSEVSKDVVITQTAASKRRCMEEVEKDTLAIYEEALSGPLQNSSRMWHLYLDFCLAQKKQYGNSPQRKDRLNSLFSSMQAKSLLQIHDFLLWAKENSEEAIDIITTGLRDFPTSVELWVAKLTEAILDCPPGKTSKELAIQFNQALQEVKKEESLPLWELGIAWALHLPDSQERLNQIFESGIYYPKSVSNRLKERYLETTLLLEDLTSFRELFQKLAKMRPNPLGLYQKFIEVEKLRKSPEKKVLRNAFEAAILDWGLEQEELWLDYVQFETELGDPGKVANVHQRALKSLTPTKCEEFVKQWTLLKFK